MSDVARRPAPLVLLGAQTRYALRDLWRTPVAAFFTLGFPLLWLVAILLVTGNPVVDDATGRRLAQFLTASAIVFSVVMACFSSLAVSVALARDRHVLKRLRGTPLPAWAYVGGRIAAAALVSLAGVVILLVVAVVAYDVQPLLRTAPAALVTLILGIACFTALGMAVVALAPTAQAAQAVTPSLLVALGFVSDMFVVGADLPAWLQSVGSFFPLKHFNAALSAQLDPYQSGAGWSLDHSAVMVAWAAVGIVVAVRFFRWEPAHHDRTAPRRTAGGAHRDGSAAPRGHDGSRLAQEEGGVRRGRPSVGRLVRHQTAYAVRAMWRDRTSTFFAIGLPVLLLVLVSFLSGDGAQIFGMPLPQYLAPALAAYGISITGYATLPASVAEARESGILKRLAGSPLPMWTYIAGRVAAALALAVATFALVVAVAVAFFEAGVNVRTLPALAVTLVVGTSCAASLGLALAFQAPSAKAVPAIALGTLLPLTFISDIFVLGAQPPEWVQSLASVFPLKHFALALAEALDPATQGSGLLTDSLLVLLAWTVVGVVAAAWRPGRRDAGRETGSDVPQGLANRRA